MEKNKKKQGTQDGWQNINEADESLQQQRLM